MFKLVIFVVAFIIIVLGILSISLCLNTYDYSDILTSRDKKNNRER